MDNILGACAKNQMREERKFVYKGKQIVMML